MRRKPSGFTLPDLLLCLLLLALLLNLALPGMQSTLQRQAGDALISDLARLMSFARAAAIDSGQMVTMCRSRDGTACNGQWLDGILIFTDANADRSINAEDRILRYSAFGIRAGSLLLRSFPNRQYVQFTPLGFTNKQNGSFTWCPPQGHSAFAQQLIFTQSGRARVAQDRDGDGIREDSGGMALNCSS